MHSKYLLLKQNLEIVQKKLTDPLTMLHLVGAEVKKRDIFIVLLHLSDKRQLSAMEKEMNEQSKFN
jgi:hypothetical protein